MTSTVEPAASPTGAAAWVALGVIVVALIWAASVTSGDKTLGDRVRAIVADEER